MECTTDSVRCALLCWVGLRSSSDAGLVIEDEGRCGAVPIVLPAHGRGVLVWTDWAYDFAATSLHYSRGICAPLNLSRQRRSRLNHCQENLRSDLNRAVWNFCSMERPVARCGQQLTELCYSIVASILSTIRAAWQGCLRTVLRIWRCLVLSLLPTALLMFESVGRPHGQWQRRYAVIA